MQTFHFQKSGSKENERLGHSAEEGRAGQFDDLQEFLKANLQKMPGFAGARRISVRHDTETGSFLIFEEWLSRERNQGDIQAISENGVMEQLLGFMEGPPDVAAYDRLLT